MITNLLLSALLPVLAQRESGGDWNAVGKRGERGLYQMTRAAWEDCSLVRRKEGLPVYGFDNAFLPSVASDYATSWLRCLEGRIRSVNGLSATRAQVLSAWNCGFRRLKLAKFDPAKCPRSTRAFVADIERAMKRTKTFPTGRVK